MKNSIYVSILVSFIMYIACESHDQAQPLLKDEFRIETRGECEECPASNQCCCAVWLQEGQSGANITICGSTSGLFNCSHPSMGTCPAFNGAIYNFNLTTSIPRGYFCSLVGAPFSITNNNSSTSALIEFTCQNDLENPQVIQFSIGPSDTEYFTNSGGCIISLCQ